MARKLVERSLDQIVLGPNVRGEFSDESVIPLARSIQECGMQNPPTVDRNGRIITGHRRARAQRLLKAESMLVIEVDVALSEADIIQRQLVENRQRQELLPSQEAAAIRRYIELTGLPQKEAAGKFGMSASAFIHAIAVAALPLTIQEAIDSGAIPKSAAYSLARIPNPDEQAARATEIMDGLLNRDELIGKLRASRKTGKAAAARKLVRGKAVLANGRSVTVNGEQLTLESFIETIEVVLAKARRYRTRGIDLPNFLKVLRSESNAAGSAV
jgi:ParB/RepB/Spo0J family partition protein